MSNHIKVVCRQVLLRSVCCSARNAETLHARGVVVSLLRFRPPNALEMREGGEPIVQIDDDQTTVQLKGQEALKGADSQGFTFDRVFEMNTKQEEVFEYGVRGIVDGEATHAVVVRPSECALTRAVRRYQRLQWNRVCLWTDRFGTSSCLPTRWDPRSHALTGENVHHDGVSHQRPDGAKHGLTFVPDREPTSMIHT
jgi:hypothetical protein